MLTPYQSCYAAWPPPRRAASDSVDSLASMLVDAQVDLNPHQVEAALFACWNPLSRGVLLADEVGNLKDKATRQHEQRALAQGRSQPRHMVFDRWDEIDNQREGLMVEQEQAFSLSSEVRPCFVIEWELA